MNLPQQLLESRLILGRLEERIAEQIDEPGILLGYALFERAQRLIGLLPFGEYLRLLVKPIVAL